MRGKYELLIGLVTFCGFIQIILLFLVRPLLYWMFPIWVVVVFLLGYKGKIVHPIKRKKDRVTFMFFILSINLVFFIFIGTAYYYNPTNAFVIGIALISTMLVTMEDFRELGMYLAQHRKITLSVEESTMETYET